MAVDLTVILTNYANFVFGSELFAALGFLVIITMIGIRYGWGLESFVIVLAPTLLIVVNTFIPIGIAPIFLIGVGLIIGFGMLAVIRR